MIDPIYIGRNGLRAQQQVLETVSNNIANLNSIAYKRQSAKLSHVIANQDGLEIAQAEGLKSADFGVVVNGVARSMTQGQVQQTDRLLDFAVQGNGFFVMQREDGSTVYSRGGSLMVDMDGYLTDRNGHRLMPEIQMDENAKRLSIGITGIVNVELIDGGVQELGQLELAMFSNPDDLLLSADGTYMPTELSGEPIISTAGEGNVGTILQGYVEGSNVNLVDEFTSLVMAQRAYEASARIVQTAGDVFDTTNELLRK